MANKFNRTLKSGEIIQYKKRGFIVEGGWGMFSFSDGTEIYGRSIGGPTIKVDSFDPLLEDVLPRDNDPLPIVREKILRPEKKENKL